MPLSLVSKQVQPVFWNRLHTHILMRSRSLGTIAKSSLSVIRRQESRRQELNVDILKVSSHQLRIRPNSNMVISVLNSVNSRYGGQADEADGFGQHLGALGIRLPADPNELEGRVLFIVIMVGR